jgi:hypothetical protein
LSKKDILAYALLIFFILFFLFVPFYKFSDASIERATRLEILKDQGKLISLFDVHKPYYEIKIAVLYKFALLIKPSLSAMSFLRFFNTLIGLIVIILFFFMLKSITGSALAGACGALIIGFGNIFWQFTKGGGGHILTLLLIVIFLWLVFRLHSKISSPVYHVIIGVALGILLLFDIVALLLIIPFFFFNPYGREGQAGLKLAALGIAIVVLALGLLICFWVTGSDNLSDFGDVLLLSLKTDPSTMQPRPVFEVSLSAAVRPFVVTGEGIIGGSGGLALVFIVLAALTIIALIVLAIIKWEYIEEIHRSIFIFSLAWLIPMLIFSAFWSTTDLSSVLLWFPVFALIAGVVVIEGKWYNMNYICWGVGFLLVVILFFGNLLQVYLPNMSRESNDEYYRAWLIREATEPGDILMYFETQEESTKEIFYKYYLPFEAKRMAFIIDWRDYYKEHVPRIKNEIQKAAGQQHGIYLLISNNLDGAMSADEFERVFEGYYLSKIYDLDPGYVLYQAR